MYVNGLLKYPLSGLRRGFQDFLNLKIGIFAVYAFSLNQ
ncbi:hypothetical protein QFZ48_003521 [Chitinophaga sp. W2I13]